MNFGRFLLAIFSGRFIRFALESLIVIHYGPQILGLLGSAFHRHLSITIAVLAAAALLTWWVVRLRKKRSRRN